MATRRLCNPTSWQRGRHYITVNNAHNSLSTMAAPDAARELRNIRDIVNLFYEGPDAVFQFLTQHGLIMGSMLCDKCLPLDGPIDCEVDAKMSLFRQNNELRWRCKARHEQTIRHHSEFSPGSMILLPTVVTTRTGMLHFDI